MQVQKQPEAAIARRARIETLAQVMARMTEQQIECEVEHTFGPGFYARTLRIPAGATVVGRIHKTEHIFFLSAGRLAIVSEDAERIIDAPFQAVFRPGTVKAVHALTECRCTNIHITESRDLAQIESACVEPAALGFEAREVLQ